MNSNVQASTAAKKSASGAIKRTLYAVLDENLPDLEEKVESITHNLLNEGPHTLESEKAYFSNFDETYFKIFTNKAYQEYLKERLSVANQAQSQPGNNSIENSYIVIGSVPGKQEEPRRMADLKDIPIDAESVQWRPQDIVKKEEKKVEAVAPRRMVDLENIPIDAESVQFSRPQDLIKKEEKKEVEVVVQQRQLEELKYIAVDSTSVFIKPQDIIKKEEVNIKFSEQNGMRDSIQYAPAQQNELSKDVEEQLRMTAQPLNNQQQPKKEEEKPVHQREEVRKEVPAARQFIQEEDIPVSNALLAETFQRLKSQAEKYDENFTLTLDLSSTENLKKESLMLPIIQKHKESDFATLFTEFRPLLFDLLKRREGFEDFTQTLRNLAKREKIASQNIIKQLEVKDILLLLVESCSQASLPQLGLWFSNQFYPLPLISLLGQKDYHSNLDCCLEYLFQVRKPLITSVGTKSAIGLGKSAFLSYLFSIKNPLLFSTKNGFTHLGAVDLYVNLPSDQQSYIVADVQSYREDKEFMNMLSGVLIASQIVLVHVTEKDISAQNGSVNLNFKVNNKKSKVIYLWRDYDDDLQSDLLAKAQKSIEKSENELAIIGIPKLNSEQSFDVQNDKLEAMNKIFEKIKTLQLNNCTPIVDLFKTFKVEEGFNKRVKDIPKNTDFDKEIKEVESLLNVESRKDKSFTKSLLPCLYQDYHIIEERKKKKVLLKQHEEMSEDEALEKEAKYNAIQERIEECMKQKSEVEASKLILKVMEVISSNELYRILLLSEVVNNWKMPQFEEIRKKYIALSAQKDGNSISEEQKKALVQEMDDKDLSLSTFLDEVLSFYETKSQSARKIDEYEGIKKYLLSSMLQGAPLNLVNGKTLKFGNGLFEEIFGKEMDDMKNIFVISIIGAQSSAKSTLLNVLFGCGFSTSAGRCTKGIYISLLHHPSGFKILVIDTEGLLSVVARDHEFDNLITTMAFSCSHVVIINNKGEINAKLRDLLEICVYAMKHLKLTTIKPKIIFALRDIADNSSQTQQEMLLAMKSSLEQAANKLSININHIIDFCQQDIFLLPSAFQLVQGDNKTSVQINNNLFSSRILEMRQYIFKYFSSIKENSIPNPRFFYIQTQQLWNNISELGSDIMRAKNFLEIELKDEALDKVNTICQVHNETLLASGQKLVEHHKAELKKADFNATALFFQVLALEFNRIKGTANTELDNKIFRNEKYAIISGYFNEFREIVEYNLRWQKQRFVSDWNASILSWETDKEIKKFKTEIKQKVNEKIKNVSLDNLTAEIITYFDDLTHKLQVEFDKNMDKLRANITNNLPGEIHTHFDRAQQVANRDKTKDRVLIPALSQVLDRIKGHTPGAYDPKIFYKHQLRFGRGDADRGIIMSEFRSFVGNLHLIITGESSDETALNVIHDCLARVRKLETDEVSVNRATFIYYGLVEAMYQQYNKAFEVETNKIQQKQKEFENVIEKEEQHIRDLLEDSSNSLAQGVRCAKHWFKEIKSAFCVDQEMLIQEAVMKKIREEFPKPESANKKAYGLSFSIRNFENCLKYILNINKFIQEIYEERMKVLSETEIEKNLELQAETFMSLIKRTIQSVREWGGDQNEHSNKIELGTLISYIDKNEGLKRYFPDLYAITLGDVKTFTRGCVDELSKEIQKNTLKEELKVIIAKKIGEYLNSQYQNLTGCQERCPMCNNKCTKADPVHRDHHTDCHLLSAFSGSHNRKTKELLLQCCFDPKHYQMAWYVGDKKFKSYDEMIDKEYPTWRQEFPRKEQPEKLKADVAPELMECWVGTKDVLTRYYGCKENTPKNWLDQVEPSKRLKANTFLAGYMKDKEEKINDV